MNLTELTSNQLLRAAKIKEQIAQLEQQLNTLLGASATASSIKGPRKGGMSAAGRARIAAAQRTRWARVKGGKASMAGKPAKKRKMSSAGLAAIKAAQKARWAKIKAAKNI